MSISSLALRAVLMASVVTLAACQSPAPNNSQYQKAEAGKLNAELSKELEEERAREKEAAQ